MPAASPHAPTRERRGRRGAVRRLHLGEPGESRSSAPARISGNRKLALIGGRWRPGNVGTQVVAVEALRLTLALVSVPTDLFYARNLKPTARRPLTRLALADRLRKDFAQRAGAWGPRAPGQADRPRLPTLADKAPRSVTPSAECSLSLGSPRILVLPTSAPCAAMTPSNLTRPDVDDFRAFSVRRRNPCVRGVPGARRAPCGSVDYPPVARVLGGRREAEITNWTCERRPTNT